MADEDLLPSIFLTSKEVEEFTGYKRPISQMEWLGCNDHQFVMNGQGRVIILRAYVENVLGLNKIAKQKREKIIEPNWAAVRR